MVTVVRKILIFFVVVVVLIAAVVVYLIATTPRGSAGIQLPLTPRERALMARVPDSAEAFVIVPSAAALEGKARSNPVTRAALDSWRASHPLPSPWMTGGADLVAWKSGKEIHYAIDLDPLRALLVRMSGIDVSGGAGEAGLDMPAMAQIGNLAAALPPGDALVVQRTSSRGAYPPLERPTVTMVKITPESIDLTSAGVASTNAGAAHQPLLQFPQSATISGSFAEPPRLINDLNRLFGAKVSALLDQGGMIALYNVDTRRFLPRPIGVIALPDDPVRKAVLDEFVKGLGALGARTGSVHGMVLLSFDDSIDQFQKDTFETLSEPDALWAVRIDAPRMVPILKALGENLGLRVIAPRLFRSARDLDRWISGLEQAKTIEGTDSVEGGVELLRVRISSK